MFTKYQQAFQPILFRVSLLSVMTFTVISCGQVEQVKIAAPAPAVSVYQIKVNEIGSYREFVARSVASKEVDLRARVEGELIDRNFSEGSIVEKSQVLLNIDPAAYQVSLESAKADLASKVAGANGAARDLKRGREVAGQGYISQSDLDKLITNDSQARASVQVAQSTLENAELNLSYTVIKAPFSGRIGKVNYSIGTIISPSSNTLATLTATDPMYVSFQVEESEYVSYLQKHKNTQKPEDLSIDISLLLPNNTQYSEKGLLTFAGTKIDQGMGTVELRAIFNNPDGIIVPGLFLTLIIEGKKKEQMALVPQVAVQESQQGKFVLVVGKDNKVSQRLVTLGRRINAMWVVESGINANERVIVEGLQKVRNGVEVKPVAKSIDPFTGIISDFLAQ
ncbi:efflux RND transporter periplasmic adaptor subunit [Colwellia sp. BRX8-9]|uniref:efflux RND transporter periplasmic adaptor subunit n=1 Tax=Colwellia sp. BRX8-9 TaxID=2759831 RepID=UPI0015F4DA13|nr:efflux RND transporter periplasmic adaptor subunit [Colwellia sp. BRX8-9]MBA6349378.1 efflux RND transporter periplasmic adaptor subunit [Colwellia sp. BRX8-9]